MGQLVARTCPIQICRHNPTDKQNILRFLKTFGTDGWKGQDIYQYKKNEGKRKTCKTRQHWLRTRIIDLPVCDLSVFPSEEMQWWCIGHTEEWITNLGMNNESKTFNWSEVHKKHNCETNIEYFPLKKVQWDSCFTVYLYGRDGFILGNLEITVVTLDYPNYSVCVLRSLIPGQ